MFQFGVPNFQVVLKETDVAAMEKMICPKMHEEVSLECVPADEERPERGEHPIPSIKGGWILPVPPSCPCPFPGFPVLCASFPV